MPNQITRVLELKARPTDAASAWECSEGSVPHFDDILRAAARCGLLYCTLADHAPVAVGPSSVVMAGLG